MIPTVSSVLVRQGKRSRSTWVFDVCGTLYNENTTAGFVAFFHRRQNNRLRGLLARAIGTAGHPVHVALVVFGKLVGCDVGRALLVSTLRGARRVELEKTAIAYVDALDAKAIPRAQMLAVEARAAGDAVILGSNSIDMVVREIAARMGAVPVSSSLGFAGDRATGRIEQEISGHKLRHVTAMLGAIVRPLVVVTDNASDGDLLAAADRRMIFCAGRMRPWMAAWDAEIIHH